HLGRQLGHALTVHQQMELVAHKTIADDSHGHAATSLADQADEGVIVVLVVEDAGANIAAVKGSVALAPASRSCSAGHAEIFLSNRQGGKKISMVGADGSLGRNRGGRKEP